MEGLLQIVGMSWRGCASGIKVVVRYVENVGELGQVVRRRRVLHEEVVVLLVGKDLGVVVYET